MFAVGGEMMTMVSMVIIIAVVLVVVCLPSLMGALFRLAAPKAATFWMSLGVGLFFAILTEALGSSRTALVGEIDSMRKMIESDQLMGVLIIVMVVIKVGIFAALATLGVDMVDRRKTKRIETT